MDEPKVIRILVAEDQAIVREGLCAMLEMKEGLSVVGVAADGEEAVAQALWLQPDVILMDLVMPRKGGVAAIREIRAQQPEAKILVLSSFSEDTQVVEALRAGATSYLLKEAMGDELVNAIRSTYAGEMSLNPLVARRLVNSFNPPPREQTLDTVLTDREMEIARLIARGCSNQEIANELNISVRTVGTHISHILKKVNLENRTQLTLQMLRQGLAPLFDN